MLERIADGELVKDVCREFAVSRWTFRNWCDDRPDFGQLYARARDMQADSCAERAVEAGRSATAEDAAAARVKMDADKWLASKLAARYNDKTVQEHTSPPDAPVRMIVDDGRKPMAVFLGEFLPKAESDEE
jgi:hypothetical protein